jgi:phosphatidylserine decarboxylase
MSPATAVVSPADARVIVTGSLQETDAVFLKDKFFSFEELIGPDAASGIIVSVNGDFAVFRLTPDKYHYNHTPVSGQGG